MRICDEIQLVINMKKWLIAAILVVLAILVAVSIFLILRFYDIYSSMENSDTEAATLQTDVESYIVPLWPSFTCEYSEGALTMTQATTISYTGALSYGKEVYCDDLAPETYLSDAVTIATDIASHCGVSAEVTFRFLSSDGEPIFTVSSDGTIWTCWGAEE